MIEDPAMELDPGAKAGPLVTPDPGPGTVEALITASPPARIKQLVEAVLNAIGGDKYNPNPGAVGNMKEFLDTPGFGEKLKKSIQKTNYQYQGQSVYKVTDRVSGFIKKGDQVYLDGEHKNHIEVFDKSGKFKAVINLDGSLNNSKTAAAKGRVLK